MRVPTFPVVVAELDEVGAGRVTVAGQQTVLPAGDLKESMRVVVELTAALARECGRPVRLHATDPSGQWEHAVDGDGTVHPLPAKNGRTPRPPEVPAIARITRGPVTAPRPAASREGDPSRSAATTARLVRGAEHEKPTPAAVLPAHTAATVVALEEDDRTVVVAPHRRPMAALTVVDSGQRVDLFEGVAIVGRRPRGATSPEAGTIFLDDPAAHLSRRHLRIEVDETEISVTDLGSSNGTWLLDADGGARRLTGDVGRVTVEPGSRLRLGTIVVAIDRK